MFTSKLKNAKLVGNPGYLHNLLGIYSKIPESYIIQDLDKTINHLSLRGGGYIQFDTSSIRWVMDQHPNTELKAATFECINFEGNYDEIIKHKNSLEYLYFSDIQFRNQKQISDLLDTVRQIKELKFLFLRSMYLLEIPHNLPQTLQYLNLDYNTVHDVSALRQYKNLKGLSLQCNGLNDMHDPYYKEKYYKNFGKDMESSNLEFLDLSFNGLNKNIPLFLDNMKKLHTVHLDTSL